MKTTIKFSFNNFRAMLRRKVSVYRLSDHTFSVPSTSVQNRAYVVSVHFNREGILDPKCNCAAGQARTGCCHALATVHAIQNDLSLMRAIVPMKKAA